MKIYLVRHGETDWNARRQIQGQTDIGLNKTGRKQAEELAVILKEKAWKGTAVYSSPQKRAAETAQIISRELVLPCHMLPGIQEVCFGKWEGLTWEEVKTNYPQYYQKWHTNRRYQRPPDGESYQDMLERVVQALRRIAMQESGDIVAVSHSAVIMALLCWLNDDSFADMVKKYKVGNVGMVEIQVQDILSKDLGQQNERIAYEMHED